MSRALFAAALVVALAWNATADACPSCAPIEGANALAVASDSGQRALRAAIDTTTDSETVGDGAARLRIREWRVALGVAGDLSPELALALRVPWVSRAATDTTTDAPLAHGAHIGDADTLLAWNFAQRGTHSLHAIAGARWPTGPRLRDASGQALLVDTQVGSGSVIPTMGLRWTVDPAARWRVETGVTALVPLPGRYEWQTGASLQGRSELAIAATPWLEVTPGVAVRHDARARIDGARDEDTGGTVAALALRVRASAERWYVQSVLDAPVVAALHGSQTRGVRVGLGLGLVLARSRSAPAPRSNPTLAFAR